MMIMMMMRRRKAGDIPGLFRGLGGDFASLYSTFHCGLDQFKYPSVSALTPTTSDGTESIHNSLIEKRGKEIKAVSREPGLSRD